MHVLDRQQHRGGARGFTLIELLVVISIIGFLSSVVIASLNTARAKGRDARRMADVRSIATALYRWEIDHNDGFMGSGSGCGNDGLGWFNHQYTGYTAMSQCLVDGQYVGQEIMDPTGSRFGSTPSNTVYTYMKYSCTLNGKATAYVYAKLETRPQTATATDGTCIASADTLYGMNYYVQLQ